MPGKYLIISEDTPEAIQKKLEGSIKAREEITGKKLDGEELRKFTAKIKRKIKKGLL